MKRILLLVIVLCNAHLLMGQWSQMASLTGTERARAVAFSIGNKVYISTGASYAVPGFKDLWEWNQATNSWTQKADFPGTGRFGAFGFSINGKGYIGAGYTSGGSLSDFYEYDPTTNAWTQKADFGGGNSDDFVAFSIGSKGYVCRTEVNEFWEYDPTTDAWTQKTDYPGFPGSGAAGFSIGTKGYVGTGEYMNNPLGSFYEWDQATDTWTQKASFPDPRDEATGFSLGAYGYIGTGHDNSTGYSTTTFYRWDQAANTWSAVSMTGGGPMMGQSVSATITYYAYVGTGYNNNGDLLKSFYQYCPNVGIENYYAEYNVAIFPNPVEDVLMFESVKNICEVRISDVLGNIVIVEKSNNMDAVSTVGLSAGVYVATFVFEDGMISNKEIVKK